MLAKDIMTMNVISVSEDSPVHEIVKLLLKHRISAVPVFDPAGTLVYCDPNGRAKAGDTDRGGSRQCSRAAHRTMTRRTGARHVR